MPLGHGLALRLYPGHKRLDYRILLSFGGGRQCFYDDYRLAAAAFQAVGASPGEYETSITVNQIGMFRAGTAHPSRSFT